MQSALRSEPTAGLHVALIMDGNGRWGVARGSSRLDGHRAGAQALRRVVEAAPELGIGTLTVYAFSADNWKRPEAEVSGLMGLFGAYLRREAARCMRQGVRLSVIGRRDRLSSGLREAVVRAEALTAGGRRMHLRVAPDPTFARPAFQAPAGLAFGPDGSLYAADSLAGKVWRLDRGQAPALALEAVLDRPEVVRVDGQGRLHVLERSVWGPRVRRFGPESQVLHAGPAAQYGVDMAVAPDGTVYLLLWDADGRRVVRLGDNVEVGRFEGGPGLAIACDVHGRLVVAHGTAVGRSREDGGWDTIAELPMPLGPSDGSGLAVDLHGRLVVAYADAGQILRIDPQRGHMETFSGPRVPVYPAVSGHGDLWVVDAHGRRIVPLSGQG